MATGAAFRRRTTRPARGADLRGLANNARVGRKKKGGRAVTPLVCPGTRRQAGEAGGARRK
jgi:hypothetical protein